MNVGDLVKLIFQPAQHPPEVAPTGIVIAKNCSPQVGLEPPNVRVTWANGEITIVFQDEVEIIEPAILDVSQVK